MKKSGVWIDIFFVMTIFFFVIALFLCVYVGVSMYEMINLVTDPPEASLPGVTSFLEIMGMLAICGVAGIAFDLAAVGFGLSLLCCKKSVVSIVEKTSKVLVYIFAVMLALIFCATIIFAIVIKQI